MQFFLVFNELNQGRANLRVDKSLYFDIHCLKARLKTIYLEIKQKCLLQKNK